MFTFLISVVLLILGYIFYGKFVERHFGADPKRETPVKKLRDGVDYQEMKPWRMFVIQFLNIAGLGPIFGAILGAAYGPMAYLWIVIGCIFMKTPAPIRATKIIIRKTAFHPCPG